MGDIGLKLKTFISITPIARHISILFCLLVLLVAQQANAQELVLSDDPDSLHRDENMSKPRFTPFLAPVFSPEVQFMLTAGGLFTFKIHALDSIVQRSSIPFSLGYSTNGSLVVNFKPFVYGRGDKWRSYGNIRIRNMPDNYWGVGYEDGKNVEKSDSTTFYHRFYWQIDANLVFKIAKNMFIGPKIDFSSTKASDLNPRMMEDPYVISQGTDLNAAGLGGILQYDSRDVAVNAYHGMYVSISATYYRPVMGGNFVYNAYSVDYRQYHQIKRPGRTLAWQAKLEYSTKDVPWANMPLLGTPLDLRGYIRGRYRDNSVVLGLVEYRHMFMRKRPNKWGTYMSRHGFVTWVGTGSVSPLVRDMSYFLPNAGIGYRFEVQPRMNVRVDYGFGNDTSGFYISFNEAF